MFTTMLQQVFAVMNEMDEMPTSTEARELIEKKCGGMLPKRIWLLAKARLEDMIDPSPTPNTEKERTDDAAENLSTTTSLSRTLIRVVETEFKQPPNDEITTIQISYVIKSRKSTGGSCKSKIGCWCTKKWTNC